MIVIADNDVLKKLACCDLFDEFSQAFEVGFEEIHVLNTARPVLSGARHRRDLGEDGLQRLADFFDAASVIEIGPDPKDLVALTEQQNIDAGEAVLFSVTPQMRGALLTTGDKRCLTRLASADDPVCRRLCKKLAGKVVCFEQVIEKILDCIGFEAVRDKLVAGRECDKVLAIVLGSGLDASETSLRAGIASYVNDLRKQTAALLMSP